MSGKNKNATLTSFFKPVSHSHASASSKTPTVKQASSISSSPLSSSSSSAAAAPPPLPTSHTTPSTSIRVTKLPPEIAASDSESDASDDSFADLNVLLNRPRPRDATPTKQKSARHEDQPFWETPRAKRTAIAFHASPIAHMPKHKFDLKALAKDARRDEATQQSSLRNLAAGEKSKPSQTGKGTLYNDDDDDQRDESKADRTSETIAEIVQANGGEAAQKVIRAVQRAESTRPQRFHFFQDPWKPPEAQPPPKGFTKGPWRLLTQGNVRIREQHLVSGVPLFMAQQVKDLPDELFLWMLSELCVSSSVLIREEYSNLISAGDSQIRRLVTAEKVEELVRKIGTTEGAFGQRFHATRDRPGISLHEGRDWGPVKSLLMFFFLVADDLATSSVTCAARCLLRMSLDTAILTNMDLLVEHQGALGRLLDALPQASLEAFMQEVCTSMQQNIPKNSVRINTLLCLSISNARTHELRRRLAATCFFDDAELGQQDEIKTLTLIDFIDRLKEEPFLIRPKTDFAELQASIAIMDMAVDDGHAPHSLDPGEEKLFNSQVDELSDRLRYIWRSINDAGMKLARTEAKSVIEWVQQRLSHSVRTKRKAKRSVFEAPSSQKDDLSLPQQQNYMKMFLSRDKVAAEGA